MKKKTPYPQLDMGLVKAYTLMIPKWQRDKFLQRGWTEASDFRQFHYHPSINETIMITKPKTLIDIGISDLIGQNVTNYATRYGSYGMGGPGFLGFKLSEQSDDDKILIYAVWGADEYTLIDGREIWCHPRYQDERNPWMKNKDELDAVLIDSKIMHCDITDDQFLVHIQQQRQDHLIEFVKNDDRLPKLGGGTDREDAFFNSSISEYILFKHSNAVLWV